MKDAGDSSSAVTLALAMLARRALTRAEVVEKLGRRVDPEARDAALARLDEMRVLDDRRLAERVAEDGLVRRGFGRYRIRSDLLRRGVDAEIVDAVVVRVFDDEAERSAAAAVLARFRKRRGSSRRAPEKEASALYRHLIGRGFPAGVVRDLLRDMQEISL
jgi:regulatory protein